MVHSSNIILPGDPDQAKVAFAHTLFSKQGPYKFRTIDFFLTGPGTPTKWTALCAAEHKRLNPAVNPWQKWSEHFDVFRRGTQRATGSHPYLPDGISTTVAQLNFVKWFVDSGAYVEYVRDLPRLEARMHECLGGNGSFIVSFD